MGHSNRTLEEFVALLHAHGVERLADIRTIPRSRKNPQFNRESLPASLEQSEIGYVHIAELGGFRHPRKGSVNSAWRNDSFRGYADYMQTPEFAAVLDRLISLAAGCRTAIMCAESVPWRCHRSLVADALAARGEVVLHIMSPARADPHKITPFARISHHRVTYPGVLENLQ